MASTSVKMTFEFDSCLCLVVIWVGSRLNFGVYDIDNDRWRWV